MCESDKTRVSQFLSTPDVWKLLFLFILSLQLQPCGCTCLCLTASSAFGSVCQDNLALVVLFCCLYACVEFFFFGWQVGQASVSGASVRLRSTPSHTNMLSVQLASLNARSHGRARARGEREVATRRCATQLPCWDFDSGPWGFRSNRLPCFHSSLRTV